MQDAYFKRRLSRTHWSSRWQLAPEGWGFHTRLFRIVFQKDARQGANLYLRKRNSHSHRRNCTALRWLGNSCLLGSCSYNPSFLPLQTISLPNKKSIKRAASPTGAKRLGLLPLVGRVEVEDHFELPYWAVD